MFLLKKSACSCFEALLPSDGKMIKKIGSVCISSLLVLLTAVGCSTDTKPVLNQEQAQVDAVLNSTVQPEKSPALASSTVQPDKRSAKNTDSADYDPSREYGSLWNSELFNADRFKLKIKLNAQEQKEAKKVARSFEAHMDRATLFMHYLLSELKKRNLPAELAALPLVESGFQPRAKSHAGARGPWQFTRQTGRSFGLKVTSNYDEFYDFIASTNASLTYLQHLYNELNHNWDLAIAAYNQGEFAVKRAIRRAKASGVAESEISKDNVPLSSHAKLYVRRFRAYAAILQNPEAFGVKHPEIENRVAFKRVKTGGRINSMRRAAQLAGVDLEVLRHLNAGYLSDSLASDRQRGLLVPVEYAARLEKALGIKSSEVDASSSVLAQY